jgi:hypothetical protein
MWYESMVVDLAERHADGLDVVQMLTMQAPSRCAACGRRQTRSRCGCTDEPRG